MTRTRKTLITLATVAGALTITAGSCDERGLGDAPAGEKNDDPAFIINMPDTFMNIAFKCVDINGDGVFSGYYAHTRAAAPLVVPNDPECKDPGQGG